MHSTHFIYGYTVSDICKRPLSKRRNPLLPLHRLLFLISSKGPFICTITWTRQYTPYLFLYYSCSSGWDGKQLSRPTMWDRSDDSLHHEQTLYHKNTSHSFHLQILCLMFKAFNNMAIAILNINKYIYLFNCYIII